MANQYHGCPKCGNDDFGDSIYGGDCSQADDAIWRQYTCGKCEFEWQEVYIFSHNEDFSANPLDDEGNIVP